MGGRSLIGPIAAALFLAACAPNPPRYFGPQLAWFPGAPDPNIINSPVFAVRAPPPGQPGYLETIRYIDNGVKYIDQHAEFFVSFDGEVCFRGLVNRQQAQFANYQNYWCMPPMTVVTVDAIENNISYVNSVRLWCRHSTPQCARRYGIANFLDESGLVANSIWAQIIPYKEARDAIRYLIYLMGGDTASSQSLRR